MAMAIGDQSYFKDASCTLSTELINTTPAKCCCARPCLYQQKKISQKSLLPENYSLKMLLHGSVIMVAHGVCLLKVEM